MKFDIYSDLHINAWSRNPLNPTDKDYLQFEPTEYCNVALFAGDAGDGLEWYFEVIRRLRSVYRYVIGVPGNHDHANSDPHNILSITQQDIGNRVYEIGDYKIVTSTLWTNFRRDLAAKELAKFGIIDFHQILGMTTDLMLQRHEEAITFLRNNAKDADIVMTHFAPHIQSEHEYYRGDPYNPYFVNHLEEFMYDLDVPLWVHGHTHKKFDYTVGNTRVVCNPHGYPNENTFEAVAKPLCIEL